MSEKEQAYRVLARKYRPQNFDDLIGQDSLVRTLKNAIESGRIAHAFMLTGIRGVGKTTTARIIAKALNYTGADGTAGPTIGPTEDCSVCQAIAQDRHPDVMEMDAASRTGIDDIREILDGVRYAPSSARYKIYIIDEVHMLSKQAFNALLKTLEEPPSHVKFIFATTEIRKVPVTILSRCQRFDLRRIDAEVLRAYYGQIAQKENVTAEDGALQLIARAADGSVRDGLSLLDQAIALGNGAVTADQVKDMLGMVDQARVTDLMETILKGQAQDALAIMTDLYQKGSDPVVIIQDLLELCHRLTRHRALPANRSSQATGEDLRIENLADQLSMPTLSRTWQILLKGLTELSQAPSPQKAAEMIVLRLLYAADLPDPADLIKKLEQGGGVNSQSFAAPRSSSSAPAASVSHSSSVIKSFDLQGATQRQQSEPQESPAAERAIHTVADIVSLLEGSGAMILATQVRLFVHPVKIMEGRIDFYPANGAPERLAQDLSVAMKTATGKRWIVSISSERGAPTLAEQADLQEKNLKDSVMSQPLIKNIFALFPDAELKDIIKLN